MAPGLVEAGFQAHAAGQAERLLRGLSHLASLAGGLPSWGAAALAAAGLLLLAAGGRSRRFIGAVGGAAVGALAAHLAGDWLARLVPGASPLALLAGGAAALGVLGVSWPWAFVFAAGALPGAALGAGVPVDGAPWTGLAVGGLALGGLAVLLAGHLSVVVASTLGAAALGGGALALAGSGVAATVAARPFLLLAWIAVVGAAGAALQHGRGFGGGRPSGRQVVSPPRRPGARGARSPGSPP